VKVGIVAEAVFVVALLQFIANVARPLGRTAE
jgi:hypothetical protein